MVFIGMIPHDATRLLLRQATSAYWKPIGEPCQVFSFISSIDDANSSILSNPQPERHSRRALRTNASRWLV
jgi:hypothetical protein